MSGATSPTSPPELMRLLKCLRRDLGAILLPELKSERAKTTATMLDYLLRHAIAREETLHCKQTEHDEKQALLLKAIGEATEKLSIGRDSSTAMQAAWSSSDCTGRAKSVLELAADAIKQSLLQQPGDADSSEARTNSIRAILAAENSYLENTKSLEEGVSSLQFSDEKQERLAVTKERLSNYIRRRFPSRPTVEVMRIDQVLGGFSKDTFLIDLMENGKAESIVMRRDLPNGPIDSSSKAEFALTSALYRLGLRVPTPLWLEEDASEFGFPFQVMRKVTGAALSGTLQLRTNEESAAACRSLAEFLAQLHSVNLSELRLDDWDPSQSTASYLSQYIGYWREVWESKRSEPSAVLTAAFEWLNHHVPTEDVRPVVVHGDAGLHNLLMENGRPTAMLDWEFAHIGHPAEDLTYCRMWVDAVMPWHEFLGCYQSHGGALVSQADERFFRILNSARNAVTCVAALRGFVVNEQPEVRSAYAGIHFYRFFLQKLVDEFSSMDLLS